MKTANILSSRTQRGVAAVEFALVSIAFFILLIGIMEMGRVLFYWNTAAEVTRLGARMAVVCDLGDAAIKARMVKLFPKLETAEITLDYLPNNCSSANCELLTVSIAPKTPIKTFIPFVPQSLTMPSFRTTLTRESMDSGDDNPVCK